MEPLIQIDHMSFRYPGGKEVLRDICLQIAAGEFVVLCGNSGCGKTTLLRQMKTAIAPHGELSGQIFFHDTPIHAMELREQAGRIGFVCQNPEDAIVTDKVWHELAFGLENLGVDNGTIRKRVAEMSHFFGIQEWFHRDIASLSGGQKQLLNLAAVMVMQPEILLLDEPTSQLDPIAAVDFLAMLGRIHREFGTTIFLTEHRLEEVLSYCSRLMVMEEGSILFDGKPERVAEALRAGRQELFQAMPAPMRIWNAVDGKSAACPMTVQEGRTWFQQYQEEHTLFPVRSEDGNDKKKEDCPIELKEVWFRYDKKGQDILKGLSLCACRGELLAVLGGNGSGKTTMLSLLHGGNLPQRGTVRVSPGCRISSLPQNPQLLFVRDTVRQELEDVTEQGKQISGHSKSCSNLSDLQAENDQADKIDEIITLCKLEKLLKRHPYDLSGGEQQRLGLAKVLLTRPDILLLDEPTKGLDVGFRTEFADILRQLKCQGVTIIMVSHDVEFCAEQADRCILLFDGQVATEDIPRRFFSENYFYTTNTNRMVRQTLPLAVTVEDVILACGGSLEKGNGEKTGKENGNPEKPAGIQSSREPVEQRPAKAKKACSMQRLSVFLVSLLAISFTIYAGIRFLGNERYVFVSLLILLECMLPFFLSFEKKKPPAGNIVVLSVLCGLGVAGRAVFAGLAQVKPVTAITILTGVAFGGEAGFLVGALTMLASNMLFGQGPWTPWQMFAMGMIGLLAGILFYGRKKQPPVWLLCVYGFLAVVLLYGGIMNPSSAIIAGLPMTWQVAAAYWLSGLPFDLVHGVATVLFLLLGAKPMLRKLERVTLKFGQANKD